MKTYLARYWAVYGFSLVAPALAACGDSGGMATEGSTGTQGTTIDEPTTGTATDPSGSTSSSTDVPTSTTSNSDSNSSSSGVVDPTTGPGTTDSTGPISASSTGASSTTGEDLCMTILCGDPPACCLDTEECVGGACTAICESGVRCGAMQEECCEAGDVCVGDSCTTPGVDCKDSYDCPPENYCEPVLGKCLPQPDGLSCVDKPTFDKVDVQLEWSWTTNEVVVAPLIADIQGDEVPEVVVTTTRIDNINFDLGEMVVLDGKTGTEIWRIKDDVPNKKYGAHGLATPVIGDVSGDGKPDIIYYGRQDAQKLGLVVAVDGDGTLLWVSHNAQNQPVKVRWDRGAAAMANLDNDPEGEIAVGGALLDNNGLVVWNQDGKSGLLGTPTDNKPQPSLIYIGGLPTFADLTGDGKPELITGREAWTINWAPGNPPVVSLTQLWKNMDGKGNDGWPAVGDIDQNGTPEVVLVAWPDIKVLDGKTGKLWCGIDPTGVMCNNNDALRTQPIAIKGSNLGGPATIADFDGDGRPEAGIAGGVAYAVYDFNRAGEEIVKPMADPMPAAGAMYARWAKTTQDNTSAATGSSVFDFQGDGAAEVAYQDECKVYVYDGKTGTSQLEILNSSSTVHEYPLVVDVDGDGNAEFLTVANMSIPVSNDACKVKTPNYMPRKGVFSYGAGADNWVPTRKVWTQHTYHVTNADSSGNVPMMEQDNWTAMDPPLNNFRQNVQGAGVFNAADLTASLAVSLNGCSAELELQATIYNEGALGVPPGIEVAFYEGSDKMGLKRGTKVTMEPILTGGSTLVTWTIDPAPGAPTNYFVEVDDGIDGGIINECFEDNNGALVTDAECPEPG